MFFFSSEKGLATKGRMSPIFPCVSPFWVGGVELFLRKWSTKKKGQFHNVPMCSSHFLVGTHMMHMAPIPID